jgi:CTP synthase
VARAAYNDQPMVIERHRHRFEFNNKYRADFIRHGMRFSGLSPDEKLVEIAEVAEHPYMIGSQFHPEFASRPDKPHPLFVGLVRAAVQFDGNANRASRQVSLNGISPDERIEP